MSSRGSVRKYDEVVRNLYTAVGGEPFVYRDLREKGVMVSAQTLKGLRWIKDVERVEWRGSNEGGHRWKLTQQAIDRIRRTANA